MKISSDATECAKKIKLIIFDVDGVLTDGGIYIGESGELFKSFHCRDGLAITLLHEVGLKTAIITGRESVCTSNRAKGLKISAVKQGCLNKRGAYKELKAEFNFCDEEIAYIADDLIDLPVLLQVGFRAAVGDASPEVQSVAHYVAKNFGGRGAVREILEFILKSQGKWEEIVRRYMSVEEPGENFSNVNQ